MFLLQMLGSNNVLMTSEVNDQTLLWLHRVMSSKLRKSLHY